MKVKFLKLKNWMLVTVMGALGLSSCHCHKELTDDGSGFKVTNPPKEREEIRLMYGVPTMDFMIRGQVKDPQGKPVKDIRVNMLERGMEVKDGELQGDPENVRRYLENTSVSTDSEGRFSISVSGRPQQEVRLLVRDVDGEANGDFSNRTVELPVKESDLEGAHGMYHGTFSTEVDIKMEKK